MPGSGGLLCSVYTTRPYERPAQQGTTGHVSRQPETGKKARCRQNVRRSNWAKIRARWHTRRHEAKSVLQYIVRTTYLGTA